MKALVTGASGAIGSALVEYLLAENHSVHALVRKSSNREGLNKRVEIFEGELTDSDSLHRAVESVDVIFHLAAKLHINSPSASLRDEYRRVNVQGTQLLAEAARRAGVRRMIFYSTINVYGSCRSGETFDETSSLNPETIYAETKADGEKIVLEALPSVVLRLAAVYGPRMKGNYPLLLNALSKGRFVKIGDGKNRRSLVFIADVCAASLLAASHSSAAGKIYNVTDGRVHTLNEIIEAISAALDKRPPRLRVPVGATRALAGMFEDGARLFGVRSPVGRATVDKLNEDVAVSAKNIERELGFQPRFNLETGWSETVRLMREERAA
ncbi:MAG TPA: NAD-dependent epimerase/dehydratase family protein [Pyrinomonadaceae bacterium]|nr:NAD-dependent epimerase/dehydratase family protein [Pyrinomonadaceae bacterium]